MNKYLRNLPSVPPALKEAARSAANTAMHAVVWSYFSKKTSDWVESRKVRVDTNTSK